MIHLRCVRLFPMTLIVCLLVMTGCLLPTAGDNTTAGAGLEITNPFDEFQRAVENEAPVAHAGEDQTVAGGQLVTLNGNASSDADGDALSYLWQQTDTYDRLELQAPFSAVARFTAPADITEATTYELTLTVTDGYAASTDVVTVTVQP